MKAQDYLSQAFLLEQQVQAKLFQVEALNSLARRMTPSYDPVHVSHSGNPGSRENVILKIMEAEAALDRKIDALVDKKLEISAVIDQVKNDSLRLLLEKRYLCFLSWDQIASDMKITKRWIYCKHERALGVVQKILDEREEKAG